MCIHLHTHTCTPPTHTLLPTHSYPTPHTWTHSVSLTLSLCQSLSLTHTLHNSMHGFGLAHVHVCTDVCDASLSLLSLYQCQNPSQGVIRCWDMADESQVKIRDQGVVGVNWVMVKKEGKMIPTNTLFLTFGSPELQKEITVGYPKVMVTLLVLYPVRCYNCNTFSHTSQSCCKMSVVWKKINLKVSVRDPRCAPTVMIPMLCLLKIAQSGRRRRKFSTSPFLKPNSR